TEGLSLRRGSRSIFNPLVPSHPLSHILDILRRLRDDEQDGVLNALRWTGDLTRMYPAPRP
ncbi:hypothetical protein ATANTOWER_016181, partial [Ataeniobius toweri]|nr:hypothetical protein [Ataeniobius toweri]